MNNKSTLGSSEYREPSRVMEFLKMYLGVLIGLVGLFIFLSISTNTFLTPDNLIVVLRQVSINAMLAFGMTYVILMGDIDLSVGMVMAFSGIITTVALTRGNVPLPMAVALGLSGGALIGIINGLIVSKLKLPSFIVTLSMSYIAKGFAYIISDGMPVSVDDPNFYAIGNGYLGPIPYPVIYMIVVFVVLSFVLYRLKFGRKVYAIGGNLEAAKYSGINVARVKIISFLVLGMLAALGGIVQCARLFSGQPTIGVNAELDAIAAVILGGTSFSGGVGTLFGSLIGALLIGIINNGLNLLGVSSFWQNVAKGAVILLAVYIDVLRKNSTKT